MNEKPAGEQGKFFRDGQTQSAQEEDQEKPSVNKLLRVVGEEDD